MTTRRQTFEYAVATLAGAALSLPLRAAEPGFPTKPVRLVVPYPAGGATDIVARLLSDKLTGRWGQGVIVDNRPGAGTTVGADIVANAPSDGYTLFMTTSAHTISASLYKKLAYSSLKDFTPITLVATIPLVLLVAQDQPIRTLSDFVRTAKADPKGISFGSPGNGTVQHLAGELFRKRAEFASIHIPYRGDAPMLTDLLGGQLQAAFCTLSVAIPYIQSGKVRALALAHPKRVDAIAAVPTFAEAGYPGFEAATWFGMLAPAGLPKDLVRSIREDVATIVVTPAVSAKLKDMGAEISNSTPEAFASFMQTESQRWKEAVKISGAQID